MMKQQTQKEPPQLDIFDLLKDDECKFEHLVSKRAQAVLEREGSYGIGITIKEGDYLTPAGAMIFALDTTVDRQEAPALVELSWLYVDKKYRRKGVGKRLMEVFGGILDETGVGGVLCDVPLDPACDGLVDYLEIRGFRFRPIDKSEYYLTWDDIARHPALSKPGKAPHVASLSDLPQEALPKALRALQLAEWEALPAEEPDPELSCIYYRKNMPAGVFLIRRKPEYMIEPLLLSAGKKPADAVPVVRDLLYHAIQKVPVQFKRMSFIYVRIRTMEGARIWDSLFPQIAPVVVRRGVYVMKGVVGYGRNR